MKILNLYAGLGGNRKLWIGHDITSVEINADICELYSRYYPGDKVIQDDAHQYLLDHYREFDFIWSSPPCQTHSDVRQKLGVLSGRNYMPVYPDMRLYQEILFLQHHFKGKWVVENVIPYYEVLIPGKQVSRHMFWSNFYIPDKVYKIEDIEHQNIEPKYGFDLADEDIPNKRQLLRNLVNPQLGYSILMAAITQTCLEDVI